ncbi:MAG: prepilin-type N-terminal cleavage/methylation domain-containing protein, partial [Proteobacteria bacterium]|nr:prepilin-type N-terminal cleavage/methylation domain-containing protein [Pseudomonadota bacterium]
MERLFLKSLRISRGFSLIEVVVALFILSTSIIVLYNLILSTNVSI